MFLTKDELIELTETSVRKKQMDWLESRGYKYDIGTKGGIKVYAKAVEERMHHQPKSRKNTPNFEALRNI
jgi:hypothetical protein